MFLLVPFLVGCGHSGSAPQSSGVDQGEIGSAAGAATSSSSATPNPWKPATASRDGGSSAGSSGSSCVSGPDGFSFTNLSDQSQSALVTSNTVTLDVPTCLSGVTVSCSGCTGIAINGGAFKQSPIQGVSSTSSGITIAVQMETSGQQNTTSDVTVTVGSTSTTWQVTTRQTRFCPWATLNQFTAQFNGIPPARMDSAEDTLIDNQYAVATIQQIVANLEAICSLPSSCTAAGTNIANIVAQLTAQWTQFAEVGWPWAVAQGAGFAYVFGAGFYNVFRAGYGNLFSGVVSCLDPSFTPTDPNS
jgi:hypothetical protein